MTTSMDTVLGKVLEAVDSIPSDTYVIYISDNGTPMYEGSYQNDLGYQIDNMYITTIGRGKGTAYQSGAWEPLVIKGPGIAAGSESSEFVHAADLFSTCLELAGLEAAPEGLVYEDYQGNPTNLDGVSLAPILFGRASMVRDPVYDYILTETSTPGSGPFGQAAIKVGARNLQYKVIRERDSLGSNTYLFYNLITDPLEEGDPASPLGVGEDCGNYEIDYGTGDARWHYCHLMEMIDDNSIF
jgi:arylsulfatase A-like enzyme